jgi:hypothetical protein
MLEEGIFANKLLKLFVFLSSLSLLILLHVSPVYTDSDLKDNEMNMIRDHIKNVKDKYPELDNKLIEIEEKLKTGTPVKDCCKDCHVKSKQ